VDLPSSRRSLQTAVGSDSVLVVYSIVQNWTVVRVSLVRVLVAKCLVVLDSVLEAECLLVLVLVLGAKCPALNSRDTSA